MAIADDISVAVNGDIRRTGDAHGGASPGYYTVLELHRFLQDLADNDSESGDDLLSIVRANPSDRSTDNIVTVLNGYNIDDDLAEYLYDGSIIQDGGDTIYDGFVNFGNTPNIIIHQNGTVIANDFWNNNGGLNPDAVAGISHRFMIKVRTGGADIDGRRVVGLTRELGFTYSEFSVNGTSRGNNVLALSHSSDLNNATAEGTIASWTDVANVEGYQTIDLNNGNGAQPYYSQWDRASRTINQLYERTKWIGRRGTSETIHGVNGELFRGITEEWAYDGESGGPFTQNETVTWTGGGSGILLAIDDNGTTGTMWIQRLTGVSPSDNDTITGGTSSATCLVNGSVTTRTPSGAFLGQSTGSAVIGAFGIGIQAADLTASDLLTDLTATTQAPPNQQSFTVGGLVSGEDRVLVAANNGSDEVDLDQLALSTALTGAAETSVVVSTTIPSDTPATGTIRILTASGVYRRVAYTSYTGSTFTIASTDFSGDNAAISNNVFISYIDELASGTTASYTAIYSSDRSLVVKVRDGGGSPIKPFITPATFGSGGGSVSAIRTADV